MSPRLRVSWVLKHWEEAEQSGRCADRIPIFSFRSSTIKDRGEKAMIGGIVGVGLVSTSRMS